MFFLNRFLSMYMMSWTTGTILLSITSYAHCSHQDSKDTIYQDRDTMYQNSLSALLTPSLCHLKLICLISKSRNSQLKNSHFMQGISMLSNYTSNHPVIPVKATVIDLAIRTGQAGRPCSQVAPDCDHADRELLLAMQDLGLASRGTQSRVRRQTDPHRYPHTDPHRYQEYQEYAPHRRIQPAVQAQAAHNYNYNPHRRQIQGIPPIFRPDAAGSRQVCRSCDQRGMVCTVYGVGTFLGCNGAVLVAGPPGQLACNVATTPGSIGCGINSLYCYTSGCGLITLPRLP